MTPDAFAGYWLPMDALLRNQGERQSGVHRQPGGFVRPAEGQQGRGRRASTARSCRATRAARRSTTARSGPPRSTRTCASWPIRRCPPTRSRRYARRSSAWSKDPEGRQVLEAGAELLKSDRRAGLRRGREPRLRQLPQVLQDHAGQVVACHQEPGSNHEQHARDSVLEELGAGFAPHARGRHRDHHRRRRADRAARGRRARPSIPRA